MRLQTKYKMLKATTIFFGALSIPWSTFTGFCFGDGRYFTGIVSLAAQTVVALVDGYIWFWVLENMKNKIQGETGITGNSVSNHGEACPFLARERKTFEGFQPGYSTTSHIATQQEDLEPRLVTRRLNLENSIKQS